MDKQTNLNYHQGLLGYFFQNNDFTDLALMSVGQKGGDLSVSQEEVEQLLPSSMRNIQSVRWVGFICPSQSGTYTFSTSDDAHTMIQVEGKLLVDQGSKESISLQQGQVYEIRVEYQQSNKGNNVTLVDFQLYWSKEGNGAEVMSQGSLLQPQRSDRDRTQKQPNIPALSLFAQKAGKTEEEARQNDAKILDDTDGDSIPDIWEINGYTIEAQKAVEWREDYHPTRGYTKFRSNPYRPHTVGDAYNDWEKAAGDIDSMIKSEARNPLVAAVPEVRVDMENIEVIKIDNVGNDVTRTESESASTSETNSITLGVNFEESFSFFSGPSVSTSLSFSYTTSSTSTFENSTSQSWSEQLNFNTSDRARLTANIRYRNTGSAPIYKVQPTSSFVLQDGSANGKTIRTVKSKENQVGEVLNPGKTYPEGGAAIALDSLDDFSTTPITIDANTLSKLEAIGSLDLQTPQAEGYYKVMLVSGGSDLRPGFASIQNDVRGRTAHITLDTGKEIIDRRVAAKDFNPIGSREDLTPELTLGDAVRLAFSGKEKDGIFYIDDIPITMDCVQIVLDNNTAKEFKTQLDKMSVKDPFKVKIKMIENRQERDSMKILIKLPMWLDTFNSEKNSWIGSGGIADGGKIGKVLKVWPSYNAYTNVTGLSPNNQNVVRAIVKPTKNQDISLYLSNNGQGYEEKFSIKANEWNILDMTVNVGDSPEKFNSISITNHGDTDILVDSVNVIKWVELEDTFKGHRVEKWDQEIDAEKKVIKGITFSKYPSVNVRYQLKIGDTFTPISPVTVPKAYLDFTAFNNGNGIQDFVELYMIDEKNDNLKTKIASDDAAFAERIKSAHKVDDILPVCPYPGLTNIAGVYFKFLDADVYNQIRGYRVLCKKLNGYLPKYLLGEDKILKVNFWDVDPHGENFIHTASTLRLKIYGVTNEGIEILVLDAQGQELPNKNPC
jgi:protective antigen